MRKEILKAELPGPPQLYTHGWNKVDTPCLYCCLSKYKIKSNSVELLSVTH